MENRIAGVNLVIGTTILVFAFSILIVSTLLFALGQPMSGLNLVLAVLVTAGFLWLGVRRSFYHHKIKIFISLALTLVLIFYVCLSISNWFYDISYDGQTYQQEGVIQLAQGWNPILQKTGHQPIYQILWLESYPKGPWIEAAALYRVTGHIEQGKVFNLLLLIASFCLSWAALLTLNPGKKIRAWWLSLLLSFNPVSINQALTFYVDGQLASLLLALAALGYLLYNRKHLLISIQVAFVAGIVMAINVKFTAVAYAFILGLGPVWWLFKDRNMRMVRRVSGLVLAGYVLGLLLVGYNPYVLNTWQHGNPFYPLAGSGTVDIMGGNMPGNFQGLNRLEKLAAATFSKTEDVYAPATTTFKIPFTVSQDELEASSLPDTRIAGFGPLTGGIVLLAMVIVMISFWWQRRETWQMAGVILVIFISAVVNPEVWWARYAPQLWIIPVLAAVLAVYLEQPLMMKGLGWLLLLVIAGNITLTSVYCFSYQYVVNRQLKEQLAALAQRREPILVKFTNSYSNRIRLTEAGIYFQLVKQLPCNKVSRLVGSDTVFCLAGSGKE